MFYILDKPVELNLEDDMRIKKINTKITKFNEKVNILKSAIIFGPNNTGKTKRIDSVKAIKNTLLNKEITFLESNMFNTSNLYELSISFRYLNKYYNYKFVYDSKSKEYIYEKMSETIFNENKKRKRIVFKRF